MNAKTALGAAAAALAILAACASRDRRASRGPAAPPPFRVRGAPHVHTAFSADGRGTVDDVARAAREAGLQFVVITDHNSQAALPEAGYRRDVLVICGLEKSTDAGHALVLGTGALPFGLDGDPEEVARDADRFGGFVVAAHPASRPGLLRWSGGWDGIAALEVLSFGPSESWPRPGMAATPFLARYLYDPTAALLAAFSFSREAVRMWDLALAHRPLAGMLGTDAHGFPSPRRVFALASQHVLLDRPLAGDGARDTAAVLDSLRRGRSYVAVDALADASAFSFAAEGARARAGPGEDLVLEGETRITADSGGVPGAHLVLRRDGAVIAEGARIDRVTREPGVYRVEGFVDGAPRGRGPDRLPWVISNPIALFPESVLAARAASRKTPSPPAAPAERRHVLEDFSGPPGPEWTIERSADATAAWRVEEEALRFDFRLGHGPHTHADLVRWKPHDLADASAITFRVRADGPTRFDLQVRTEWPGHDPSLRIWRRSVRAEREWTEVAVPLDALKTYDGQPGRPDLRRVVGLYVHVDEATLPPRSRGSLWIDDLALVATSGHER